MMLRILLIVLLLSQCCSATEAGWFDGPFIKDISKGKVDKVKRRLENGKNPNGVKEIRVGYKLYTPPPPSYKDSYYRRHYYCDDDGDFVNAKYENKYEYLRSLSYLQWAVKKGRQEIVTLLLDYGAHVNMRIKSVRVLRSKWVKEGDGMSDLKMTYREPSQQEEGWETGATALFYPVRRGDISMARLLLERKADPNVTDYKGDTPLVLALERKNGQMADLLLNFNADVNLGKNVTPLMIAVSHGDVAQIRKLIARGAGAKINKKDHSGNTALHYAAKLPNSYWGVLEILLENGANVTIENNGNITPRGIALREGRDQIYEKLKAYEQ